MKIYVGKKPKPGAPDCFTIGEQVVRLTDKQYKALGFERPLRRLAKILKKKGPIPSAMMIGIEVHGVSVNFLLKPDSGEKKAD